MNKYLKWSLCLIVFIMFSTFHHTESVNAKSFDSVPMQYLTLTRKLQADKIYVKRILSFKDFAYPPKGYWVEQGEYKGYIYQIDLGPHYYVYAGYIHKGPYASLSVDKEYSE
ncbi:hypothetical protein JDW15_08745 [Aerococcaceae bacterium zg-ZJ1578]|uniref:hypothetical protein n=1 Tax=Aerococcaceae bacterium zg-252 TaxID=2796928 RepID=UPI001A192FD2|nr:hypothetical protein [Aerococcaceae bacterium zg-1578]